MSKLMKTHISLTRYLYFKDEVKYSLLLSLLDKSDVNCSLFWAYELYYSGYEEELFQYLFCIYFDFYSLINPKFYYSTLVNQYNIWLKTHDTSTIGVIIKNIFILNYTYTIFCLRQHIKLNEQKKLKGRKPKWCDSYKSEYVPLLRCINKRNYNSIYYHIANMKDDILKYSLYEVAKYFENEEKKEIPKEFYDSYEDGLKEALNLIYNNFQHIVLVTIFHLLQYHDISEKKRFIIKLNENEIKSYLDIQNEICKPLWRTLEMKRLYGIHPNIGYFQLCRDSLKHMDDSKFIPEIQDNWLYYARLTPCFKNILDNYENIKINHEKREIEFKDDDDFEDFYDNHGYFEPDEQTRDTQNKVFLYKKECNINDLFKDDKKNIENLNIQFNNSSKFIY